MPACPRASQRYRHAPPVSILVIAHRVLWIIRCVAARSLSNRAPAARRSDESVGREPNRRRRPSPPALIVAFACATGAVGGALSVEIAWGRCRERCGRSRSREHETSRRSPPGGLLRSACFGGPRRSRTGMVVGWAMPWRSPTSGGVRQGAIVTRCRASPLAQPDLQCRRVRLGGRLFCCQ
jgi:hypothetical protein